MKTILPSIIRREIDFRELETVYSEASKLCSRIATADEQITNIKDEVNSELFGKYSNELQERLRLSLERNQLKKRELSRQLEIILKTTKKSTLTF